MNRVARDVLLRSPARSRRPIDVEVMSQKCRLTFFDKRVRVCVISRNLSGPWSELLSPLPPADVQHDDVSRPNLDTGLLLPGFEIGARDRRPWLDPIDAFQLRHVVKHRTGDD